MAGTFMKDPSAKLDYGIDWTQWLGADTLVSSGWRVEVPATAGDGVHLSVATAPEAAIEDKVTRVWLEGGVAGVAYDVVNTITTTAGRTDERTLKVVVRQR